MRNQVKERHLSSIINFSNKDKGRTRERNSNHQSNKFTSDELKYVEQNGSLLFKFTQNKLSIIKHINQLITGQKIISLSKQKMFLQAISQIQEFNQSLVSFYDQQKITFQRFNKVQCNEVLNQQLLNVTQSAQKLIEYLGKLNKVQQNETQQIPLIKTSRNPSPLPKNSLKNQKNLSSTNHASRIRSVKPIKVKQFENFVNIQFDQAINNQNQQSFQQDKFSQNEDSLNQDGFLQKENLLLNKSPFQNQKLKDYFYSFIITLAATDSRWHSFLNSLFSQLSFSQQFPAQKIQQMMIKDHQYCLKISIITLKNKFSKYFQHQIQKDEFLNSQSVTYFANDINFIELSYYFLQNNLQQVISKIKEFCQKAKQICQIFKQIDHLTNQNQQNQNNQNFKDTLSRYLPYNNPNQGLRQFTFSSTALQNLTTQVRRTFSMKENQYALSASINIFQKIIVKICFDRILNCKRFNFEAVNYIFQIIQNSNAIYSTLNHSFATLKSFFEEEKMVELNCNYFTQNYQQKKLSKIFIQWKRIKQRKLKLLKFLINKKIKLQKKEQNLIFNRWRINISRLRIQKKMIAHSQSCASVMNKFTQKQVQDVQIRNHSKNKSNQKSINMMSEITIKKSLSTKKTPSSSNKFSSLSSMNSINYKKTSENTKLLNYQYKQEILEKLNKQTRKSSYKNSQPMEKLLLKQKRTVLKV